MRHRFDEPIEKGGIKVIECKDCGFKHIYPLPSEEELKEYYQTSYSIL